MQVKKYLKDWFKLYNKTKCKVIPKNVYILIQLKIIYMIKICDYQAIIQGHIIYILDIVTGYYGSVLGPRSDFFYLLSRRNYHLIWRY